MLQYHEALKLIARHTPKPNTRNVPLRQARGCILAKDLSARHPLPSFDNAAVDGYAVPSLKKSFSTLEVKEEVKAGYGSAKAIVSGEAVRIFTGAPIPKGTFAVVMQEGVERTNGAVLIKMRPRLHENIRFQGEDVKKGEKLLKTGTLLGPVHLALLASFGYSKVPVFSPPRVAILATGSELVQPGEKLAPGKIFDCNSLLLETLVQESGAVPMGLRTVGDDPVQIRAGVRQGLKEDVLIVAGGVSVGDYDFVKGILKEEGVKEIFWKINVKPGKPVFFGKRKGTLVFGLPGNSVSVYVTFLEFVQPVLLNIQGKKSKKVICEGALTRGFRNGPRWHFVRVACSAGQKGYQMTPLQGQGSHMIGSLAKANAILQLPPHACVRAGSHVRVKMTGGFV